MTWNQRELIHALAIVRSHAKQLEGAIFDDITFAEFAAMCEKWQGDLELDTETRKLHERIGYEFSREAPRNEPGTGDYFKELGEKILRLAEGAPRCGIGRPPCIRPRGHHGTCAIA